MGLFDSTPDYAGLASKSEANRKGIIGLGLDEINAVFSGGTAPFFSNTSGKFDPKGNYFSFGSGGKNKGKLIPYWVGDKGGLSPSFQPKDGGLNTSLWPHGTASAFLFGGGPVGNFFGDLLGGDGPSPKDNANKLFKQGRLFTEKDQTFQGFTPDFYNKAQQSYIDYALPQLAQQHGDTQRSLEFGLSNRGLSSSGAKNRAMSDLATATGQAEQGIFDTGRSTAQNLQKQIEAARQSAIAALYQSADPSQGMQSAIGSAAQFSQPLAFTPLANAFGGLANQYAQNFLYNPQVQGMGGYAANPWQSYGQGLGGNPGAIPGPVQY